MTVCIIVTLEGYVALHLQGGGETYEALSFQVIFCQICQRALTLVALLQKEICNWAQGRRMGFSPGAAERHRGRTTGPADGVS